MGNHRFRLSDILMPNAWFHKLKVMSRGSRSPALHHATKKPHSSRTLGSSPSTPKPPAPPHLPAEQLCLQPRRASYYFPSGRQEKPPGSPAHPRASDTHFPIDPPRKSKKKARRKQAKPSHKLVSSDSAGSWSCRATRGAVWEGDAMPDVLPTATAPERPPCLQKEVYADADADDEDADGSVPCFDKLIIAQHYGNCDSVTAWSGSCSCKVASPARVGVVMDVPSSTSPATAKLELLALPPILTKPTKKEPEPTTKLEDSKHMSSKAKSSRKQVSLPPLKDTQKSSISPRRPSPPGAQGLRLRGATSPRLASKKLRACRSRKAAAPTPKRTLSESFAVVKSSSDPQRDFRDSMMEMIMENNIRASADLEDLLACYLSLNSNEYHDVIVKVFEQIWLDLTDAKCREVRRLSHCKRG